jgi:hypothetical protein
MGESGEGGLFVSLVEFKTRHPYTNVATDMWRPRHKITIGGGETSPDPRSPPA